MVFERFFMYLFYVDLTPSPYGDFLKFNVQYELKYFVPNISRVLIIESLEYQF